MSKCKCGDTVDILKSSECRRCYGRRHREENRAQYNARKNAYARRTYVPVPIFYTVTMPPTTPCTSKAALRRVLNYRGKATERVCPCGAQAETWSYRGGSEYEQTGPSYKGSQTTTTWSSHIKDYSALCRACSEAGNSGGSKGFSDAGSRVPGVPLRFLSPAGGTE